MHGENLAAYSERASITWAPEKPAFELSRKIKLFPEVPFYSLQRPGWFN
jgi:hypothetical protein